MSHTIEEKKSRDLMVRLIRAVDYIEKHQNHEKIEIPEPSMNPSDYFADIPKGFYDKELRDIESMDSEFVDAELELMGCDKEAIANNLAIAKSKNVSSLPIPKETTVETSAIKLNDNIFSYVLKEALGKSFMLTKEDDGKITSKEESDETPIRIEATQGDKKSARRSGFHIQKAAFMVGAFLFTSLAIAGVKPIVERVSYLLTKYEVRKPPNRVNPILPVEYANNNLYFDQLDLNYKNATELLDKIKSGEVYLTTEERRELYRKMYSLAKEDAQIVKSNSDSFDPRRACTESSLYKHVVQEEDTIVNVIGNCNYTIRDSLFNITEVLNVDDILLIKVNKNYEVIRIDIDKHKKSGIKSLFNSASS